MTTIAEHDAQLRRDSEAVFAKMDAIGRDLDEIGRRWEAERDRLRAEAQRRGLLAEEEQ
jgi:hypothetical protein